MMTSTRKGGQRLRSVVMLLVLAAVVGAVAVAVAAEIIRIASAWSGEAPTVDGKLADWSSPLVSLPSANVSLGVRNDGQFLYVAIASSDQAARMVLGAAGFTIWVDPSGKQKKTFGITVPPTMGMGRGMSGPGPGGGGLGQGGQPPDWQGAPPQGQPGASGQPGQEGREGQREGSPGGPGSPAIGTITSIEVLGASKDDKRRFELTYARTIGIDAAARMAEGVLAYELRVPLAVSEAQPYGVKSAPRATIGLGIETADLPRPGGRGEDGGRGRGGMGGGPPGGGGRGGSVGGGMGGGGMPGGMGGPPDGGREGMREMKPIKAWTVVQLATPPA